MKILKRFNKTILEKSNTNKNYNKILFVSNALASIILLAYVIYFPNFAITGPSSLDAWIYRGFALNWGDNLGFPQSNWGGYYKESRIPYIIFLYLLGKIVESYYFTLFLAYLTLISLYILYWFIFRLDSIALRTAISVLASLNPLLLSSGGFYYHNNFIYILFLFSIVILQSKLKFLLKINIYILLSTLGIIVNPIVTGVFFLPLFFYFYNFKNSFKVIKKVSIGVLYSFCLIIFYTLVLGFINKYIFYQKGRFWESQLNHLLAIDRGYLSTWYMPFGVWIFYNPYSVICIVFLIISLYFTYFYSSDFERILHVAYIANFALFTYAHYLGNPLWNSEYMLFPLILLGFTSFFISFVNSINFKLNIYSLPFFTSLIIISTYVQNFRSSSPINLLALAFIILIIILIYYNKVNLLLLIFLIFIAISIRPISWNYENNTNGLALAFDREIIKIQEEVRYSSPESKLTFVWADPTVKIDMYYAGIHPSNFANASAQMGLIYLGAPFPQMNFKEFMDFDQLEDVLSNDELLIFASSEEMKRYKYFFEYKFGLNIYYKEFEISNFPDYKYSITRLN